MKSYISFIILNFAILIIDGYAFCLGSSYSRQADYRLQCGIFKTLALSFFDCQKQCTATLNCFSFNTYQSDNSTETCELVRGSKDSFQDKECLVQKDGTVYNELKDIKECSSERNCSGKMTRKALPDDWYQLGSSAFKHFKTKKTWKDANDTCFANKASLVTIDSELENRFITELFVKSSALIGVLRLWKLDGSDKDVVLKGGASYKSAVLDLPGTAGSYATTPAVDIQRTSFSISFWVKLRSVPSKLFSHLYSHPVNPYIFSFGIETTSKGRRVYLLAKTKTGSYIFHAIGGNLIVNKWSHVVGTWDRKTKKAAVYINGVQVGQYTSTQSNLDLLNYIQNIYRVGLHQSDIVINALMKELIVFNVPLTSEEVNLLNTHDLSHVLREVWIGPTHPYSIWAPALESSSNCVSLRSWELHQHNKVPCDQVMEFICEKRVD